MRSPPVSRYPRRMPASEAAFLLRCPQCGTELASSLLSCPSCGRLVHAEELKQIAAEAERAADPTQAMVAWRRALALLPAGSRQQQTISEKINALVIQSEKAPSPGAQPKRAPGSKIAWGSIASVAGVTIALLFKFKFVLLFILTKGKLLLLGLTKASTFFTMFLSFGLYWSLWGWKFAAGLVLSIYVHEMGHVAMLRRLGVRASAPMFIPGLGAIVLLKEHLPTAREDARVGLAGPIWGLGAALFAFVIAVAWPSPMFAAIAKLGAWINLFNLTPVWQLDGSRAFRALTRKQRWIAVAVVGAMLLLTSEVMLLLVLVVAFARACEKNPAPEPDQRALIEYAVLVVALALLASIRVAV